MKNRLFFALSLAVMSSLAGCMQTRHIESNTVTACSAGEVCNDSTYSERRWFGFWPCQPSQIQP
jgi:hypothetical protein